ncbi:hypothetical protein [Kitasatospora sp. NPDC059673]|uniref:hypothetical protein n=1 Tax=Kitasatospora sp. NPDC059673 TaxID=3346901 RepID=UPI003685DADC
MLHGFQDVEELASRLLGVVLNGRQGRRDGTDLFRSVQRPGGGQQLRQAFGA